MYSEISYFEMGMTLLLCFEKLMSWNKISTNEISHFYTQMTTSIHYRTISIGQDLQVLRKQTCVGINVANTHVHVTTLM